MLTDVNKYSRLKFALNFMAHGQDICEMLDYVHLDKKGFYLTLVNRKFYLVPGEKPPERKCNRFITKVMFLTAVTRPQLNEDTGVWSERGPSSSTIETQVISVTKDVYRAYLLGKVLPALVQKWPSRGRTIMLQHDYARAHVTTKDYPFERLDHTFMTLQLSTYLESMAALDSEVTAALEAAGLEAIDMNDE
ncbi:hypothetical protein DYB31_013494 [Aphanomyces astaci]|uniref:DDE-1 domain-containing protein n=1 Tax=Aphanomyces astaci TaxID=112090 RepID=A0A397FUW2_APHAT|nr:hypothetical protein DYB31_013494 [Aphanomyces astaci]